MLLYGNASWRNGGARVMLLKDTELVSSSVKIINLGLHTPRSVMYPVDKTIYASVSHMKKRERKKRGYCFTICRSTIYLVFPGNVLYFPPGFPPVPVPPLKKCFMSKGLDKWS